MTSDLLEPISTKETVGASNLPLDTVYRQTLSFTPTTIENTDSGLDEFDSATTIAFENELRRLTEVYLFSSNGSVMGFLSTNKKCVPLLFKALPWIETYFPGCICTLELHLDPEDGSKRLFIVARNSMGPTEAISAQWGLLNSDFDEILTASEGLLALGEDSL